MEHRVAWLRFGEAWEGHCFSEKYDASLGCCEFRRAATLKRHVSVLLKVTGAARELYYK